MEKETLEKWAQRRGCGTCRGRCWFTSGCSCAGETICHDPGVFGGPLQSSPHTAWGARVFSALSTSTGPHPTFLPKETKCFLRERSELLWLYTETGKVGPSDGKVRE